MGWHFYTALFFAWTFVGANRFLSAETLLGSVISDQILDSQDAVESISVHYSARTAITGSEEFQSSIEVRLKACGSQRFREVIHWSPSRPRAVDFNHMQQFLTKTEFNVLYVAQRIYERASYVEHSVAPWKLRYDLVMDCLGWWPADDIAPPVASGSPAQFLRFSAQSVDYQTSGEMDLDGIHCLCLKSGQDDLIWVAPERSFAILRRETRDPRGNGSVRKQLSSDLKRARGPGKTFWYPARSRIEITNPSVPNEGVRTIEVNVHSLVINSVRSEAFTPQLLPGTLIDNKDTGEIVQIPGGLDLLDDSIQMGKSILDLASKQHDSSDREWPVNQSAPHLWWLAYAAIGLIALSLISHGKYIFRCSFVGKVREEVN